MTHQSSDSTFRLAVIGNESSILLYRAFGAESFGVFTAEEAKDRVEELMQKHKGDELKTPLYAVIFVEEDFYQLLPDDLVEKLARKPLPALIPVPTPSETGKSFATQRLSTIVERAVGSDILN